MGDYARLSRAIDGERLPLALVDLDAFDANARRLAGLAGDKPLRVATKSLRCPALIERALAGGGRGLMTYTAEETLFWFDRGERDLLLAYPTMQRSDAAILAATGARVVVDATEQLDLLASVARERGRPVHVVVEVDLALHALGAHLGVRRSPLRTPEDVLSLARRVRRTDGLRFAGVMGYEAQIAGVRDRDGSLTAPVKRAMKRSSQAEVARRRGAIASALREDGFTIELFNGGGTGSLATSSREPALTEVTAGSGYLDSHLFDGYDAVPLSPAAFFALQVVRRASATIVTCAGGGYIASGGAGKDRLPRPWLPEGLSLLDLEGAGEVQTPLDGAVSLPLAAPVFFRHAKAGELAEHFLEYLLVQGDRVVDRVPTYRGLGRCFLG